jgi:membrane associated rhomboid family serine protease
MYFNSNQFRAPEVVKNLIILNVLFFLATIAFSRLNVNLTDILGMFYFQSVNFKPWSLITHFFMHGGLMHLFFNMFGLWMFGSRLEQIWGPRRFLTFYFITAVGAFLLHFLVVYIRIQSILPELDNETIQMVIENGREVLLSGRNYTDPNVGSLNRLINVPVVGASGALFGILAAFAMYFPNTELFLIFIPVPIKAKYFVLLYAGFELFSGITQFGGDNIAHFAHLGGALMGYILVKYWNKSNRNSLY